MKSKKWVVLAACIALLAVLAYAFRVQLATAIAQRVALERLSTDFQKSLPDGLYVGICGAGSPFPDDRRAGPCTVVFAGARMFVFDAGSGSVKTLGRMGLNVGAIDTIFLTHFHSDHIDGLGEMMLQRWVSGGHHQPVSVVGPTGVDPVVRGLMFAYGQDQHYRVAHHGDATVTPSGFGGVAQAFEPGRGDPVVVLKDADLEIAAFAVDHSPVHPSVGYRIRYKDRSVVLSGDTKRSDAVVKAAQGADLLVHEALSVPLMKVLADSASQAGRSKLQKIFGDIVDYHSTPEEAAQVAKQAGVRALVLNHIVPALPALPGLEDAFLGQAKSHYAGPIKVALDGDFISLPVGGQTIEFSRR